ncbi:Hint domain-containing protein [Planktotalea sp.]|uniref:Hint domain-containing protein n=1 Tax=Planktotalea sp. TaxID=2029877 RepID=UPI003D6A35A8
MLLKNTRVLTREGYCPVEQLKAGDQVCSAFGKTKSLTILAVMSRGVPIFSGAGRDRLPATDLTPVMIPAGAFGRDEPHRDVFLSSQQRILAPSKQRPQGPYGIRCVADCEYLSDKRPGKNEFHWADYFALFFEYESLFIADGVAVVGYSREVLTSTPSVSKNNQLIRKALLNDE